MSKKSKEQREQEKAKQRLDNKKSKQKKSPIALIIVGLVVIAVVALIVMGVRRSAQEIPGEQLEDLGREHIELGKEHDEYNSNPPTSGPHSGPANWGVYAEPVAYERQVHNLEHGGVIIHYHPDAITNLEELKTLFQDLSSRKTKLMLVPNDTLDTTYAITAWTRLDAFDEYDEDRIETFVNKYYNRAPERTNE